MGQEEVKVAVFREEEIEEGECKGGGTKEEVGDSKDKVTKAEAVSLDLIKITEGGEEGAIRIGGMGAIMIIGATKTVGGGIKIGVVLKTEVVIKIEVEAVVIRIRVTGTFTEEVEGVAEGVEEEKEINIKNLSTHIRLILTWKVTEKPLLVHGSFRTAVFLFMQFYIFIQLLCSSLVMLYVSTFKCLDCRVERKSVM